MYVATQYIRRECCSEKSNHNLFTISVILKFLTHTPGEHVAVEMKSFVLQGVVLLLAFVYGALSQGQGLSEEEQEEILNAHNYYRRTVDPIATNMLRMVRAS